MTLIYGNDSKCNHPSELSAAAAVTTYIQENQPQTQYQKPPSLDLIEHQETENNQDETVTADPKDVKYKFVKKSLGGGFFYQFTYNKNNFSSHGKLHVFSIILSFIYFKVVLSLVQYHH